MLAMARGAGVIGHGGGVLPRAAVLEVGGDPRRPEGVVVDPGLDPRRLRPPAHHRVGIGLRQRGAGQLDDAVDGQRRRDVGEQVNRERGLGGAQHAPAAARVLQPESVTAARSASGSSADRAKQRALSQRKSPEKPICSQVSGDVWARSTTPWATSWAMRGSPLATRTSPGLQELLAYARPGDTLAVVRLDRLGRSLAELLATVAMLKERSIALLSLEERIDTGAGDPATSLVSQQAGANRIDGDYALT